MNEEIEKLNLKKLYVFLYICKNDLIKEEETKTSIDELLNNEIFNNIDKNITIPTGIFNKCNSNTIIKDVIDGLVIIIKKLGIKYKVFYYEIFRKFIFLFLIEKHFEEDKINDMNLETLKKYFKNFTYQNIKNKYVNHSKENPSLKVTKINNTINSIVKNSVSITYKNYKEIMTELLQLDNNVVNRFFKKSKLFEEGGREI
jgi:hypothetical protein